MGTFLLPNLDLRQLQTYPRKSTLILLSFGTLCLVITVLIHRGIHGKFGVGIHGLSVVFLGSLPFFALFVLRLSQLKLRWCPSLAIAQSLSICLVVYYLSSNGLWCAQHPHVTRALCAKLVQFKSFAASSKITFWWLTLGDLLAVHRGRVRPIPWEHDVDICITPEQYPLFEKALRSNASYFQPKAECLESGHCYLPIDMAKLGLTTREAEGVNVDIWTCPQLSGSIKRVLYCNDFMNVPGSLPERHAILSKHYGNYSTVKYAHHATMCRIWND